MRAPLAHGHSRKPRSAECGRRSWPPEPFPFPQAADRRSGSAPGLLEKGEVGISATNRNFKGRMGSREAQCYLASPEVVAASAIAGYITGPRQFQDRAPVRQYEEFATNGRTAERVEILPGFPERVEGAASPSIPGVRT